MISENKDKLGTSETEEIVDFSSITLGKVSCTIPNFTSTDLDKNISSLVPAQMTAVVVV